MESFAKIFNELSRRTAEELILNQKALNLVTAMNLILPNLEQSKKLLILEIYEEIINSTDKLNTINELFKDKEKFSNYQKNAKECLEFLVKCSPNEFTSEDYLLLSLLVSLFYKNDEKGNFAEDFTNAVINPDSNIKPDCLFILHALAPDKIIVNFFKENQVLIISPENLTFELLTDLNLNIQDLLKIPGQDFTVSSLKIQNPPFVIIANVGKLLEIASRKEVKSDFIKKAMSKMFTIESQKANQLLKLSSGAIKTPLTNGVIRGLVPFTFFMTIIRATQKFKKT